MTKLTPTLTQSGLLAVLLQRQRYKVFQLARRRAHRKHLRAAFWSTLTWRGALSRRQRSSTIPPSPLWEPSGAALSYESRLLEPMYTLPRTGSNESIVATHRALEQGTRR